MHHVVVSIAGRQGVHALISLYPNCLVLCASCPSLDANRGAHWKQPLYSYGVVVMCSTSYSPQTLP
ncbi:hypothetical protein Hanom_Chr14g01268451 [Helianthus anomalus]